MVAMYSRLPASPAHIRVLELFPGIGPLICQLRVVALGECRYETISYCWSDAAEDDPVLIVNEQRIKIRKNLAGALTRLRLPDQARTLWVDALCIDQTSNVEKREQVSMMREMYAGGDHNNIWLGEQEPCTAGVLNFARRLAELGKSRSANAIFTLMSSPHKLLYSSDSSLYGLWDLCDKSWFHRGWIVQEVTAAKASTAHCGSCSISWEELSKAKELLMPVRSTYDSLGNQRRAYISNNDDLASVLARNVAYQYTDPRDRVYAMLGLVEQGPRRYGIVADYVADPTDVLVRTTYACIYQRGNLDILSIVPSRVGESEDCPSWMISSRFSWENDIMAFQTFAWGSQLSRNLLDRRPQFCCTAGSALSCDMDLEDRTLKLKGVVWDHVEKVAIPYSWKPTRATKFGFFNDILDGLYPWLVWRRLAKVSRTEMYHLTQETRFTVFWHIVSGGVLYDDYFIEEAFYAQFEETYKIFLWLPHDWCSCRTIMAIVLVFCFFRAWILIVIGKKNLSSMAFRQCPIICNRTMFVTVGGALGMGPKAMQAGDFILLAQGGKVPLVVRQLHDKRWQLIGESYVHGIMHGEAYDETLCEPIVIV